MVKKEIAELLRSKSIHNEHNVTKKGHPFVYVRHPDSGRDVTPNAVVLVVKGMHFKNAAWYENGARWFSYHGKEGKKERIEEVMAWIEKNFPGLKMSPSPFGRDAWVPEEDLNEALNQPVRRSKNETMATD